MLYIHSYHHCELLPIGEPHFCHWWILAELCMQPRPPAVWACACYGMHVISNTQKTGSSYQTGSSFPPVSSWVSNWNVSNRCAEETSSTAAVEFLEEAAQMTHLMPSAANGLWWRSWSCTACKLTSASLVSPQHTTSEPRQIWTSGATSLNVP